MRSVSDVLETATGWLSAEQLGQARERVPMVYVDAVPVRVDASGQVVRVGLLLRAMPDGSISRAVVSGRVLYGERVRDALLRHLEKDLGPVALPRVPVAPQPFTVVEYFPDPGVTGFTDPRQHAVSLAFVVPCDGDCVPSQDALDLAWLTPEEAVSAGVQEAMTGGQDRLVRLALAHCGRLP
jgi:ADP-ribose pyrophosphatase YjhB (NUDIX family)